MLVSLAALARQAAVLVGLSALAGAVVYAVHPRAPAFYLESEPLAQDEVSADAIRERWAGDVFWVDARPRAEYEAGHIPGAFLLNEQEWESQLFEHYERIIANDRPVVVYCGTRSCESSQKITRRLREQVGLAEVYYLRGGWEEAREFAR